MAVKKVSITMLKALRAIHDQGGEAYEVRNPVCGPQWRGLDGCELRYPSDTVQNFVATNTIYALHDRDFLRVARYSSTPFVRYDLTDKAHEWINGGRVPSMAHWENQE